MTCLPAGCSQAPGVPATSTQFPPWWWSERRGRRRGEGRRGGGGGVGKEGRRGGGDSLEGDGEHGLPGVSCSITALEHVAT